MEAKKLAVIRIRGITGVKVDARNTMRMLKLYKKNYCRVLDSSPSAIGMLQKVKDFVTWGEISNETFQELVKKRADPYSGRTEDLRTKRKFSFITIDRKNIKPVFRLNPPRGGFERKGIKKGFNDGGALGYRGEKMNELIRKMI